MKKKTIQFKYISTILLSFVCCLALLLAMPCDAAARTGSIDIDFEGRTDDIDDVILSGAKFEIFPIQYMDNGELVWRDEFAGCGISLDDTSAEAREKQAKQLFQYAKDHNIKGIIHTTDSKGHTQFLDLAEGLYLLTELGDVTEGVDVFASEPFLVKIPSEVGGKFEYDVDVEPKADWISHDGYPVGPEPEPEPGTNPDDTPKPGKQPPDGSTDIPGEEQGSEIKTSENVSDEITGPVAQLVHRVKTSDTMQVYLWGTMIIIALLVITLVKKKEK